MIQPNKSSYEQHFLSQIGDKFKKIKAINIVFTLIHSSRFSESKIVQIIKKVLVDINPYRKTIFILILFIKSRPGVSKLQPADKS